MYGFGRKTCKLPAGVPRFRCEDNINMDYKEIVCVGGGKFIWFRTGTGGNLL
jgi:hypothetical protein